MIEHIEAKEEKGYSGDDRYQPLLRGESLKHIIGTLPRH